MTVQQQNMDVLANNLANADTTGFKRDMSVVQSFTAEMMKRLHDPEGLSNEEVIIPWLKKHDVKAGDVSLGAFIGGVYTDFSSGRFINTNNPLDLAINDTPRDDLGNFEGNQISPGFFVINTLDRDGNITPHYTRDGKFVLDQERVLRTLEGNTVAGVNNPTITIPDCAEIMIHEDGGVYTMLTGGEIQYIDHLMLVGFANLDSLRKTGDNLYRAGEWTEFAPFGGSVMQKMLEGSNIKPVAEMVRMITVQRAYEVNQKMIISQNETLAHAVSTIGKKTH
jgi:flagellar basal-body rod protein FlgG